ncbi:MAG TPA: DUF2231 domain-containing protein [Burkholderiales bacterium]|nr:DUF2231 domain-containing protein [Burkholderiales bacterium]
MKTPGSILRIPVHAVLGMIPFGVWAFAQFSDFMFFCEKGPEWVSSAFYAYLTGTVVAVASLPHGFIDYSSMTGRRARAVAFFHMASALLVIVLICISIALRWNVSATSPLAMLVASTGFLIFLATLALGLYLVHVHAVGVSTEAETPVSPVPDMSAKTRMHVD